MTSEAVRQAMYKRADGLRDVILAQDERRRQNFEASRSAALAAENESTCDGCGAATSLSLCGACAEGK